MSVSRSDICGRLLERRIYPSDYKIPEALKRQLAAKQSPASSSQGAVIRFSSPSLRGGIQDDQGFDSGNGISDDFKLWLSRHPGLSIEEAIRRYRDEQKTKQRRTDPKL